MSNPRLRNRKNFQWNIRAKNWFHTNYEVEAPFKNYFSLDGEITYAVWTIRSPLNPAGSSYLTGYVEFKEERTIYDLRGNANCWVSTLSNEIEQRACLMKGPILYGPYEIGVPYKKVKLETVVDSEQLFEASLLSYEFPATSESNNNKHFSIFS